MRFRPCVIVVVGVLALGGAAPPAWAGKVVVVPVILGAPTSDDGAVGLAGSVAAGLGANPRWEVLVGPASKKQLEDGGRAPATDADWDRLAGLADRVTAQFGKDPPADVMAAAESAADESQRAFRAGPWSARGADLVWRTGGLLAAALAANGDADRAHKVAVETTLLFPGRAPADTDQLPRVASDLLAPTTGGGSARLAIDTRPEGCDIYVNGRKTSTKHFEVEAAAGGAYWSWAECPGGVRTRPRRIAPAAQTSAHVEMLDAEYDKALDCSKGDCRLHFASADNRRSLEESYARRTAEMFEVDAVVFVSVGALAGQDWLSARLYLANGFQVRVGLARLVPQRAQALGTYLATGKEMAGVLNPTDAAALVVVSQKGPGGDGSGGPQPAMRPWYSDWLGWALIGGGAAFAAGGLVMRSHANEDYRMSDAIRGDPDRQASLASTAQTLSAGSFMMFGVGASLAATGVIMLIIPDRSVESQAVAVAPTPGGAALTVQGRF